MTEMTREWSGEFSRVLAETFQARVATLGGEDQHAVKPSGRFANGEPFPVTSSAAFPSPGRAVAVRRGGWVDELDLGAEVEADSLGTHVTWEKDEDAPRPDALAGLLAEQADRRLLALVAQAGGRPGRLVYSTGGMQTKAWTEVGGTNHLMAQTEIGMALVVGPTVSG